MILVNGRLEYGPIPDDFDDEAHQYHTIFQEKMDRAVQAALDLLAGELLVISDKEKRMNVTLKVFYKKIV